MSDISKLAQKLGREEEVGFVWEVLLGRPICT